VYTFVDSKALLQDSALRQINEDYIEKRTRIGLRKKIISPISAQDYFLKNDNSNIEVRFIKDGFYPFKSGMQIYDNKVSFQTIDRQNKIAVIIEDENIYKMHKLTFEFMWENLGNA